jgi:hypothetical protein
MDVLEELDDVVARLAQADPFSFSDRAAVRVLASIHRLAV